MLLTPRATEHAKYVRAYQSEAYRMHGSRLAFAKADLAALPCRGSYLDVGCGRGTMLEEADRLGFHPVHGVEVVPALLSERVFMAEAYALPFDTGAFDVVTLFDVIEHLLPGDDALACAELLRVARRHLLVTANARSSTNHTGEELHINRRPHEEWDRVLREWFAGATVTWLRQDDFATQTWRIDL